MHKLLKYIKWWYWLIVILICGIVYLQVTFDLLLPEYINKIIELIGIQNKTGISQTSNIWQQGFNMLYVTLGSVISTVIVVFLASKLGASFSKNLRSRVYEKVQSFSLEELNKFSTASLITRTTNDVQQIQTVVIIILRMAITAPIMASLGITKIWEISKDMSLLVAIGVFAIVTLVTTIFVLAIPRFKKIQTYTDNLNLVTRENLTGLRVVRAHNAEKFEEQKFNKVNNDLTNTHLFVGRVMSFMMPGMQIVMNMLNLFIIWVGAWLISNNALGSGTFMGLGLLIQFTTYAMYIVMSFMMLTMTFIMIPRAAVSGKRISEVLETKLSIKDYGVLQTNANLESDDLNGTIEYQNVSFKYPNAEGYVLEDINLKINAGETVAFIGSTGSGKSTIINLIPRFYDASIGNVLINGKNVKEYAQTDLYNMLGYVPQKALLFSGTIATNLKMGNENASVDQINEALQIAQAEEFVSKMENGINHPISQGGKNVSGGQKQRLCIARAVIRKPQIYIFDDSFSALDYRTDRSLRKVLNEKTKNATKLIVAQRIGTIITADKIVVLDKGRIVAVGTHQELIKICSIYQEMAYSQLSKEELDYAK
jgi:ATP-binding cassette subfamily B protein